MCATRVATQVTHGCHMCATCVPHVWATCVSLVYHMCATCAPRALPHMCHMCATCVPHVGHMCATCAPDVCHMCAVAPKSPCLSRRGPRLGHHPTEATCWVHPVRNLHQGEAFFGEPPTLDFRAVRRVCCTGLAPRTKTNTDQIATNIVVLSFSAAKDRWCLRVFNATHGIMQCCATCAPRVLPHV